MTLTIAPKKTVAAAILIAPLALAACGSNEDENVAEGMATETNVVTVDPEAEKPADDKEKKDDDKDKDKDKDEESKPEDAPKPENDPAAQGVPNEGAAGVVNPFEDGTLPTVEAKPVEGGQQASESDVKGMTDTMNKIYNPKDLVSWSRVIMENSCQKVVDQTNQELAGRGTSLEQTEREMQQAVDAARAAGRPLPPVPQTQAELSDVRVDGDSASATVTVNTNGQTESGVQRFQREGDQWKVCN